MTGARGSNGAVFTASVVSAVAAMIVVGGLDAGCVGQLGFDPVAATTNGSGGAGPPIGAGSGGARVSASGGASATGGATGTGGASAIGGTNADGGASGAGAAAANGGDSAVGGGSANGGDSGAGAATANGGAGAIGGAGAGGTAGRSSSGSGGTAGGAGSKGTGGTGSTAATCPSGFNTRSTILINKCGGCHGSKSPAAGLDFVSTGLAARLVNKPSSCRNLPYLTLNANGAASGFLLDKLAGPVTNCGARMPLGAAPLSATEMACVNDWAVGEIALGTP